MKANELFKLKEAQRSFRQLNSQNMQSTLIQFEDYLDQNHIYAFENWIEGLVWDGPNVRRYWVDITLKYDYEQMPDPKGAARLVSTGAKITYKEDKEMVPMDSKDPDNLDPVSRKPKEEERKIWLINISVPRRFIEDAVDDYEDMDQEAPKDEPVESDEPEEEGVDEGIDGAGDLDLDDLEL
jgi:hypothetical protein